MKRKSVGALRERERERERELHFSEMKKIGGESNG